MKRLIFILVVATTFVFGMLGCSKDDPKSIKYRGVTEIKVSDDYVIDCTGRAYSYEVCFLVDVCNGEFEVIINDLKYEFREDFIHRNFITSNML